MNKLVMRLAGFSFYSALIKLSFGFIFLMPPHTFASTPSYTAMAALASENVWGIALVMIGMLHISSIFSHNLIARIVMQIVSIAVWLFISSMFGISNPIGTGLWTYGIAAVCDFIAIVYLLRFEKGEYK